MECKRLRNRIWLWGSLMAVMLSAAGCSESEVSPAANTEESVIELETEIQTSAEETMMALTPEGPLLPSLEGVEAEYKEPAPDYLRVGVEHQIVKELQQRLMELGFMDNDEPTEYYGTMTQEAVKKYQRQNGLAQDGIVGPSTLLSILDPNSKYYAVEKGVSGNDILWIQNRLYELGYLPTSNLISGNFDDATEAAVKKMQEVNSLEQDGKVGRQSMNLLYSDDVKPNMLHYGEKSDVVLAAQKRLKELGYMTSEPDGNYGNDTIIAVKQFQARNDQVVDGYLGPSTRIALNNVEAVPNGLGLGDQGDTVVKVQEMLSKLGYLVAGNVTGYYGEATEKAVKSFQTTNGLSADGSVGVMTMTKLTSGSAKKAPPAPKTTAAKKTTKASNNNKNNSNKNNSNKNNTGGTPNTGNAPAGSSAGALISVASSKLGSPYVYGAKGPNSFDCSGFIYWCLNQVGVKQSYMTSAGWRNAGRYTKITSFSNLQAGDIIVVKGHVGIVAGGGTVIDASSSNGKVVHRSLSSWWANNFICGWRIF